jgi:4-hydroxybenzoyl-CoA thioesterase
VNEGAASASKGARGAWSPYEVTTPVRFGACDPAGIMYFPNYFDFFHAAMEDFFRDRVGARYHLLLERARVTFPTVHLEVDFRSPLRHGDLVRITVEVARIGRSTVDLRYTARRAGDGAVCAVAVATTVATDIDAMKSVPVPDELRAPLERERLAAAAPSPSPP